MNLPPASLVTICGLDELNCYNAQPVTHVLSILDPDGLEPDVLSQFRPQHRTILRFHDDIEPGPNLVLPQTEHIERILAFGRSLSDGNGGGTHLLVHCHMGVSRSTAAFVALLADINPKEHESNIFSYLLQLRPQAWPNSLMIFLADELLGRGGRLVSALKQFYAIQLTRRPEIGPYWRSKGRGREVVMGLPHIED